MPKLTPKQQQKKLRRHNPIARTTTAAGSAVISGSGNGHREPQEPTQDLIPVINNLPLPSSSQSYPISIDDDEKIHRALLSLNSLLLSKASRVALLAPKHMLLQRLLHHLNHHRLEVRKEAAGCLRNICVEGQWNGREQIWNLGGGATALAQIEYAAMELGLLPKASREGQVIQTETTAVPTNAKKPEDMNRKERRQAAKAAKSANGDSAVLNAVAPAIATPASAAAEADAHDLHLLHLSLVENHLTIIWCILETVSSPLWLTQLNKSILGELLCSAIARGATAYTSPTATTGKVSQKEKEEIQSAEIDLALTAANVLATWMEDNPTAAASLVGLPLELTEQVVAFEAGGNSSAPGTKSRRRLETILERFGSLSGKQAQHGLIRLEQLSSAAGLLSSTKMTSPEDLQRLNLGLLALASCSNILNALPSTLRALVPSPASPSSSSKTLMQWQVSYATPLLLTFLTTNGESAPFWTSVTKGASASRGTGGKEKLKTATGMDVDVQQHGEGEGIQDEGEDAPGTSLTTRKIDTMILAMELLGEICTEAESEDISLLSEAMSDSTAATADVMEEDDEEDREGSEDTLDSEQEEEMLMLAEGDRNGEAGNADDDGDLSMETGAPDPANGSIVKSKVGGKKQLWESPYSTLLIQHNLPSSLLSVLAVQESTTVSWSTASASSRDFTLASHSTLASLLSAVASHAQPPPTHPLEAGSKKERQVRIFQRWVAERGKLLKATWQGLLHWSTVVHSVVQRCSREEECEWAVTLAIPIWTSLNALVVMHEGLEVVPLPLPSVPTDGSSTSSLETIFAGSLKTFMEYPGLDGTPSALVASLIISTLSCLARVPTLVPSEEAQQPTLLERNSFTAQTLLSLLSLYTSSSSSSEAPGNSSSSKVVRANIQPLLATLNSFIDIYADETSPWDIPIFRSGNLLEKLLSLTSLPDPPGIGSGGGRGQVERGGAGGGGGGGGKLIRDRIRSIDRRKYEDLRNEADEVWENWTAWLKYRKGLPS